MAETQVKLSIVVIGKNQGCFLERCFNSIRVMSWKGDYEVIYIDTASTDESMRIARSCGVEAISINPPQPSAAIARNVGWKIARYPLVFFLDGDTLLDPYFVEKALSAYQDPNVAVVCGHRREIFPDASIYQAVLDLDWVFSCGEVAWCGGDVIIRKDVLEVVKGYNGALIAGEDADLSHRIGECGYKLVRLDIPMTRHDLNMHSFFQYWRRCFRTGYAYAAVADSTRGKLWRFESHYNLWKGGGILVAAAVSLAALSWTISPAVVFVLLAIFLVARTSISVRKRCSSLRVCVAYGIHAHFQHVPMFFGQLSYLFHPHRSLIEYH